MPTKAYILATEAVAGSTLMQAIDLLTTSNRIGRQINANNDNIFDIELTAAQPRITMNNGQSLQCSHSLADVSQEAYIVIPAPMIATREELDAYLQGNQVVVDWLGEYGKHCRLLATHCAGLALLAEAGLLADEPVTTAWFLAREIKRRYPSINIEADKLLIKHTSLITGGATGAINDVTLAFIERIAGAHHSRLLAKYMLLDNQRPNQAPYAILSDIPLNDDVVERSSKWLRKNLAGDFCVEDIANAVQVSARTLIRRVRKSVDESPQTLTQKLRIEKSKVLLETTKLPLTDIVIRVGYSDESAFRRIFSRLVGLSPAEYRRRFKSHFNSM